MGPVCFDSAGVVHWDLGFSAHCRQRAVRGWRQYQNPRPGASKRQAISKARRRCGTTVMMAVDLGPGRARNPREETRGKGRRSPRRVPAASTPPRQQKHQDAHGGVDHAGGWWRAKTHAERRRTTNRSGSGAAVCLPREGLFSFRGSGVQPVRSRIRPAVDSSPPSRASSRRRRSMRVPSMSRNSFISLASAWLFSSNWISAKARFSSAE